MKVTLLPSCVGSPADQEFSYLTSYLINDTLAIDAGSLGFYRGPDCQERVRHVLISHTHIDHIASLPIFLENCYRDSPDCVTIHGSEAVLRCLQQDILNDRVWPDFIALSRAMPERPFLKLAPLQDFVPLELEGLRITPIPVNHLVPTHGFIVEEDGKSIIIPSDTGPTEAIWQHARRCGDVRAIFLEACFPNEFDWLARTTLHLTPQMFAAELGKFGKPVRTIAVHIKARFHQQVVSELGALGMPWMEVGQPRTYDLD